MSVSKWAYVPEKCDGKPCYGDCDYCPIKYEDISAIVCLREVENGNTDQDTDKNVW